MMRYPPMPCLFQCTKRNTEKSHEPTSVLPSQRGFKLASLNINKLITHIDQLRILLAHNVRILLAHNVLLHKEFEIPSLHSKFCRDIEVRVSVRSCTQVILRKI